MQYVADLHLHSKYSRAVSRDMVLPIMAAWANKKGIDILTTGDWTHPLWFREIRGQLEEANEGLFKLKSSQSEQKEPLFLLSVEVSSIYAQGGQMRRIHNLIFSPSFQTSEKINKELQKRGCNLMADGRPIIGLSARTLLELVLSIDKRALLIPCHAWTPWFSLYGSNSGFDSIPECFGDYAKYIYGIETGISSDPEMNWRIPELDNLSILSFSDAHSPAKMGREATVFELPELTYTMLRRAIAGPAVHSSQGAPSSFVSSNEDALLGSPPLASPAPKIAYTIEFYPEEGKYHYTGHRNCKVVQTPDETRTKGTTCPVCGRKLTVGVMHRVEQLAVPQSQNANVKTQNDKYGVSWIKDENEKRPPFVKLVPLLEIVAEALFSTTASLKVREMFDRLVTSFGSEFAVLLRTSTSEIEKVVGPRVAEGIKKVRSGDIAIAPGFDGEYGKVKIWNNEVESSELKVESEKSKEQLGLF